MTIMELGHRNEAFTGSVVNLENGGSSEQKVHNSQNNLTTKPPILNKTNQPQQNAHGPSLDHPTSFFETLTHLLRGNIGSGVFAMGDAFKNGGLVLGSILTLFLGIICVHNQHILLKCSRKIKHKIGLEEDPDFAETVELCFIHGSPRLTHFAKTSKFLVNIFICITQLGFCCVYFVFASSSLGQVLEYYGHNFGIYNNMLIVSIPILLPSLIMNLKYLAPCSSIANVCMAAGIGVVFYFAFQELPNLNERKFIGNVETIPLFFGTAMFAFEGIALVLPLRNAMRKPETFNSTAGVLNIGISFVTVLYISFGFFGYLKWGDDVAGSLTLNLPQSITAQIVKLAAAFGMCLTYSLQFFIPIQIMLPTVQKLFQHRLPPTVIELLFRFLCVAITFGIAALVPHLNVFISLIGALCSTALALFFPAVIQLVLAYGSPKGCSQFVKIKNSFIILFSLFGLITGTYESLHSLVNIFKKS